MAEIIQLFPQRGQVTSNVEINKILCENTFAAGMTAAHMATIIQCLKATEGERLKRQNRIRLQEVITFNEKNL